MTTAELARLFDVTPKTIADLSKRRIIERAGHGPWKLQASVTGYVCICVGSFFNPLAFLVRAIRPSYQKSAPMAFTAMITVSCLLTTIGYAGSAWLFTRVVLDLG
jgi:hypothetical protein